LYTDKVATAVHILNGFGKSTGIEQIRETGTLETPILLTNTLNVWRAADSLLDWMLKDNPDIGIRTRGTVNPMVGECHDGWLSDIQGRHVNREHVWTALESASSGPVAEGNVGGGTGTRTYEFKAGIGTSSRVIPEKRGGFTVGVLVQANFGLRRQLAIRGLPIGKWLGDWPDKDDREISKTSEDFGDQIEPGGSCMMVVATDAPLSSRQLWRLAKRAPLGLARTGTVSGPGSGDYVIAFSTTNRRRPRDNQPVQTVEHLTEEWASFGNLAQAVVEATEEAVLNSLAAAKTIEGRDGHVAYSLPVEKVREWLRPVIDAETKDKA
jgi:D-aminopeptidase